MNRILQYRYILRRNVFALLGLCLTVYFSYHALLGQRSYMRLMMLEGEISRAADMHDQLVETRQQVERRVVMMRPGSLDRDLLEERITAVLGYNPDDTVIVLKGKL